MRNLQRSHQGSCFTFRPAGGKGMQRSSDPEDLRHPVPSGLGAGQGDLCTSAPALEPRGVTPAPGRPADSGTVAHDGATGPVGCRLSNWANIHCHFHW